MASKDSKKGMAKCHFVSNTHWDREWRFSMQKTRHMLVYMLDMLLDIFEKSGEFHSFHLDSQTIPLQDYLEIRPEKTDTVKKLVQDKKLLVGPWYVLPDEFSLSGESLVRNLLLGHKIANEFGHVSKTGYSPFGWGQISQLPQIYKNFGIDFAAFYRGVNRESAPKSEYIWQGADGTQVVASRLAHRPRYNVWYIIQRPAYFGQVDENNRVIPWGCGDGPMKFVGNKYSGYDAQYSRPAFKYDSTVIPERAAQAMEEQDGDWTTPNRFWSCGHDSSCPDIREVDMIKDCNNALGDKAEVFHSTFEQFQKAVLEDVDMSSLDIIEGEMRSCQDCKTVSPLFGWIISARMDVKIDNFKTERELMGYAEPLAVFASMMGAPYPKGFLDVSSNWLLQNHGHDSIGGCSREIISDDMLFRSRQSREISGAVAERALLDIAGTIDYKGRSVDDVVLLTYNVAPFKRDDVVDINIEIPREAEAKDFEIVDENGAVLEIQKLGNGDSFQVVQSPNDTANCFLTHQYRCKALLKDVPAMGYKAFYVKSKDKEVFTRSASMVTGPNKMENEFLAVSINSNGTMEITDKVTGKSYSNMGYYRDTAEVGNPWQHFDVENTEDYTTLGENAKITLVCDGPLEVAYKIELDWLLPACRTADDKSRSSEKKTVNIVSVVTLKKGQKWLDVKTDLDNTVEDHYLQVAYPAEIKADKVSVSGQFDVIERDVKLPYSENYMESPQPEQPMNSFVDISDGKIGLAFLNEGMKAYEATDTDTPEMRLTLVRSFPLRICVTQEMTDYSQIDKSSQCLGKHSYHYAIMPHKGTWADANIWNAAEQFNLDLIVAQTAPPVKTGTEPAEKSFLELSDDKLHVSAVKQGEAGDSWIVRLFNPYSDTVKTSIRLNGGFVNNPDVPSPVERLKTDMALPGKSSKNWPSVKVVTMEELPQDDLKLDRDGWVKLSVDSKKILTLEFK